MPAMDPDNSKIDVEIEIDAEEAQLAHVVQLINQHARDICAPVRIENRYSAQPKRHVITFSTTDREFVGEWAMEWLNQALIDGRRSVNTTITPR